MKNNIMKYTKKEKENFQNGKVKVAESKKQILEFVMFSKKVGNNNKLYLGKINEKLANKIQKNTGINLKNYNISLKNNAIRHIMNHHSNNNETKRGQIPIAITDFKLIPKIVNDFDEVSSCLDAPNNKFSITFKKIIGNTYYLVNYISDKSKCLEVQTMWKFKNKKNNSATASNAKSLD